MLRCRDVGRAGHFIPHAQGAPCWQPQPQPQAAGAAAGVWQPQVQAAPRQGLQAQALALVFMVRLLGRSRAGSGPQGKVSALCPVMA